MQETKANHQLNHRMIADVLDVLISVYPNMMKAEALYQKVFGDFHSGMENDPDWYDNVKRPLDKEYDFNMNFLMEHGHTHGFNKTWGCPS